MRYHRWKKIHQTPLLSQPHAFFWRRLFFDWLLRLQAQGQEDWILIRSFYNTTCFFSNHWNKKQQHIYGGSWVSAGLLSGCFLSELSGWVTSGVIAFSNSFSRLRLTGLPDSFPSSPPAAELEDPRTVAEVSPSATPAAELEECFCLAFSSLRAFTPSWKDSKSRFFLASWSSFDRSPSASSSPALGGSDLDLALPLAWLLALLFGARFGTFLVWGFSPLDSCFSSTAFAAARIFRCA